MATKKPVKKQTKKPVKNAPKKTTKKKVVKKQVKAPVKKIRVRKIRFGRIIFVLILLFFVVYLLSKLIHFPLKNIYVSGNTLFSDQEIIEMLSLEEYPSYFAYTKSEMRSKLEKNPFIKKAKIKKKNLKEVYIEIDENKPLFYDESKEQVVLEDGTLTDTKFSVPTLLNYIPDTIYDTFLKKFAALDEDIFNRISEIKYDPNDVDDKRFLIYMNDGNQVYVTTYTMLKLNHYVDIMKEVILKYEDKCGTLFLDEGEYFELFD